MLDEYAVSSEMSNQILGGLVRITVNPYGSSARSYRLEPVKLLGLGCYVGRETSNFVDKLVFEHGLMDDREKADVVFATT